MKHEAQADPLTRNIESRTANQMIKFENVGFNLDFFRRSNRMEMVLPGDDSLSTIFCCSCPNDFTNDPENRNSQQSTAVYIKLQNTCIFFHGHVSSQTILIYISFNIYSSTDISEDQKWWSDGCCFCVCLSRLCVPQHLLTDWDFLDITSNSPLPRRTTVKVSIICIFKTFLTASIDIHKK